MTATTKGIGDKEKFKPVTSKKFRLVIENNDEAPSLLELQMYESD